MGYVLGIDLGTSYSAAAMYDDNRAEIVQLGSRAAVIPSLVVLRADGEILTGEAAERRSFSEPTRTAREFKRRLGDPTPLILGGTPYGAESVMAFLFKAIVDHSVRQRGEAPSLVAITHPASYSQYKLDLLSQAARQADIGETILLSEPEAAAIHYAEQARVETGAVIAVYDFGGGTFDASVLRKTADGFELLGRPEGLDRLGGIDFDEAVFQHVLISIRDQLDDSDLKGPDAQGALVRLREECREAKEGLSADTEAVVAVAMPSLHTEVRITRTEFESLVAPRIRETVSALDRSIRSASITMADVDRILLVGGTSRIPIVGAIVREMTGRPVAVDSHPKHAVALGAAVVAHRHIAQMPDRHIAQMPDSQAAVPAAGRQGGANAGQLTAPLAAPTPANLSPITGPGNARDESPLPASPRAAADTPAAAIGPEKVPSSPVAPARSETHRQPPVAASPGRNRKFYAVGLSAAMVVAVGAVFAFLRGGSEERDLAAAGGPTEAATSVVVSPTPGPGANVTVGVPPTTLATSTLVVSSPTSPPPTATPTLAPNTSRISAIGIVNGRFSVAFQVAGFTPQVTSQHVHFFFDTVPPLQAGVPGAGPWFLYGGSSPFTGYSVNERPAGATQVCVLVARADHSVIQGTGNCMPLPN